MPLQLFPQFYAYTSDDREPTQADWETLLPNIGTATLTFKITYSIYSP